MPTVLSICGSPALASRTARLLSIVDRRLELTGCEVVPIQVRALPTDALLHGDADHPAIVRVADLLRCADGVVIGTPIYKTAYSGILKSLLDVLPQYAFAGKAVLPLASGGSTAHMLAIDYALRPVLSSMAPGYVAAGRFFLDRLVTIRADGTASIEVETEDLLNRMADDFAAVLNARPQAALVDRIGATPL